MVTKGKKITTGDLFSNRRQTLQQHPKGAGKVKSVKGTRRGARR